MAARMVFLGAPGVGKGTFAQRLAPELKIPSISTGDLVRAEIKAQTPRGRELKVSMTLLVARPPLARAS
jgi:adenylate kinase